MKLIRRVHGGGGNQFKKRVAMMVLAISSLFRDLVELASLGFLTSDLHEFVLIQDDFFQNWWWQERGNSGKDE